MEYLVVQSDSYDEFLQQIHFRIQTGWKFQGGVCVVYIPTAEYRFHQAMTKEKGE